MENQTGASTLLKQEQLNTIQENLTRVQMDTVEDLPFSKFLVNLDV